MRSQGQVKFIRISSRLQLTIAGLIAGALLVWAVVTLAMLVSQIGLVSERIALDQQRAKVASSASRVAAYRQSVDEVADDLQKRQAYLETMVDSFVGEDPNAAADAPVGEAANASGETEAEKTVRKISALIPEAASLARMEARQIAFVEQMTRAAEVRANRAAAAIRRFGLNPDAAARASASAQGGPFIPYPGDDLDPRFEGLGKALARMDQLERALVAIPSGKPAISTPITSTFGYRRDPFTGRAAMHAGIDFKGAHGQAILAAAPGKVVFAGRKSGYGNAIEVMHGNGLMTRYAHLSRITVRPGQKVAKGEKLGAMGSTGRSTGTHLHFEVRQNGRAMNPRPFLEANRDVLEIQAVAKQRTDTAAG